MCKLSKLGFLTADPDCYPVGRSRLLTAANQDSGKHFTSVTHNLGDPALFERPQTTCYLAQWCEM